MVQLFLTAYVGLWRRNWLEKQFQIGRFSREFRDERLAIGAPRKDEDRLIWVHVDGEESALGLSEFLVRLEELGLGRILLTSTEDLPDHFVSKRLSRNVIYRRSPLGLRTVVTQFLNNWSPNAIVWASPGLHFRALHESSKLNIPLIWVDLRLTHATRRRWLLAVNYYRSMIRKFDLILCQDRITRKLLRSLGVGRQKIHVTGSFVGGAFIPEDNRDERTQWTNALKDRQIWLAAQVPPGELNTVYDSFAKARRSAHRLILVLQTSSSRPDGLRGDQFYIADRPSATEYEREWDVIIVGKKDLGMWYRIAPVTYLGGNLSEDNSHNPFPPAQLGSALITGPNWSRYRDLYHRLDQREALEVVAGAQSLAKSVVQTLAPDRAASLAHAAWDVSTEGAQVADRAVAYVADLVGAERTQDEAA